MGRRRVREEIARLDALSKTRELTRFESGFLQKMITTERRMMRPLHSTKGQTNGT